MSAKILEITWNNTDLGDDEKEVLLATAKLSDGKEIKVNALTHHHALKKINLEFIKHVTGQFINFPKNT